MKKISRPDIIAGTLTILWEGTSLFILFQQWNTLQKTEVLILLIFMLLFPIMFWGKEIKSWFKKLIVLLVILFYYQTANSQILIENISFPSFENNPQAFEPQVTFSIDSDWDFHHFSLNTSGTFSALNGITLGKDLYPYIFLSYNPWSSTSYSSIGVSKDIFLSDRIGCIGYIELGIADADYGNWSISIGAIYSIELPNFKRKRR